MVVDPPSSPPDGPLLSASDFERLFPFYLAISGEGLITNIGHSLARISSSIKAGQPLSNVLEPLRPEAPFDVPKLRNSPKILSLIREIDSGLILRGQWVADRDEGVLFVGSPWLSDTAELSQRNLQIEDFAIHDPAVDLLHILRSQKMATEDLRRLTEKLTQQRAQLKETNSRLTAQENESRKLALIAARTHNAVVLTDARGNTEWINAGFTRLTGYEIDELRGKPPGSRLQGPDTSLEQIDYMRRCIREQKGFNVELLNYSKSGRRYWVSIEVQPITDPEGVVTHYMAIESDITGRRRAEADMRAQFRIAQILAAGTSFDRVKSDLLSTLGEELEWDVANLWMHDEARQRLVLSQSWSTDDDLLERFKRAANQPDLACDIGLPGLTWQTLETQWVERIADYPACPRSHAAHQSGLCSAVAFPIHIGSIKLGVIELMSTRHEGADAERELSLASIGVQIAQFVERVLSREELRQRSEQLYELNGELKLANRAKDDFLASISHEIRTPLNGVIGAADSLGLSSLNAHQQEALETLSTSAKHLLSVLNDVLDFSRIEAGHLELQPEPLLLRTLVDDVTKIFLPISRQKRLQFLVDPAPGNQLAVRADATRIRQILVNLLGNAFKFTQHGSVRFRIQHRLEGDSVWLRFVIEDTGIGIPPDRVKLLFLPFSQLDSTQTRNYGGTGLGLAISRRLAELMNGNLGLDEQVNTGSRFYFELTVPRSDPPKLLVSSVAPLQSNGDLLIVDDHEANATILSMLLRQLGLTAKYCPDAQSAIAYCAIHHPPLVFMDVHMPQIDGFEATRLIRKATPPGQPRITIIALTADVRSEVRAACVAADMDDFLTKPIRLTELHKMLANYLTDGSIEPIVDERTPPSPPPPQAAGIDEGDHGLDLEIANIIFDVADSPELTAEVSEMFKSLWDDIPAALDQITKAQETGQTATGQSLCHRLKGVLANYGFKQAAEILNRMETDSAAFSRPGQIMALRATLHLGHAEMLNRFPFLR